MSQKIRVKLDHQQVAKLLTSNAMYSVLEPVGEKVLAAVKEAAPVVSGAYRDSLHLERALTDRSVIRVVAGVSYGLAVEAKDAPMAVGLNRSRHG